MVRPVADDAALCEAKVRAELAAADIPGAVMWSGSVFPAVALVKGEPGPAERAGGAAVTGSDREAAEKALAALGVDGETWATLSRPVPGMAPGAVHARLRGQLFAVDASVVIALDAVAASDLAAALEIEPPGFGTPVEVSGMTLLAVDGLEASLGEEDHKRAVWSQFQGLLRPPVSPANERGALRRPAGDSLF